MALLFRAPEATLRSMPEQFLAAPRSLQQRDVSRLHQRGVQKADNLDDLASLFDASGHRWLAHLDVRRIGLLLAQAMESNAQLCTPKALRARIFSRVRSVVLGAWR